MNTFSGWKWMKEKRNEVACCVFKHWADSVKSRARTRFDVAPLAFTAERRPRERCLNLLDKLSLESTRPLPLATPPVP